MARRGRSQTGRTAVRTEPVTGSRTAAVPSESSARTTAPAPVQRFYVTIENLMQQTLEVSVLNEHGSVEGLRLPPRGKSRPVEANRVGSYTRDLETQGRVRIVNVSG